MGIIFKEAIDGIIYAISEERKIKFHISMGIIVIVIFSRLLNPVELSIIMIVIFLVISSEVINTAIERLCDIVEPSIKFDIKVVKDMSAGFVLLSVILSIIIFITIIIPKLWIAW